MSIYFKIMLLLICYLPNISIAGADEHAYLGVSFAKTNLKFNKDFGGNVLGNSPKQLAMTFGTKFSDNVGAALDVGFIGPKDVEEKAVPTNTKVLGYKFTTAFTADSKYDVTYGGIGLFYEIAALQSLSLKLQASMVLAKLNIKFTAQDLNEIAMVKKRLITNMVASVGYNLNKHFMLSFFGMQMGTSKIKYRKKEVSNPFNEELITLHVKMANMTAYGVRAIFFPFR